MIMSRRSLGLIIAVMVLPGCMKDIGGIREGFVSRFRTAEPEAALQQTGGATPAVVKPADASPIIFALQTRPSALEPGTPYARVADAVIASDSRVEEAELYVAQLRAEAAQKNWMPKIGPVISLNSLGEFVAQLVINQVIYDNGRKVAERDLAKANVEEAAVNLVDAGNKRVYDALSLYLVSQENGQLSGHLSKAAQDMARFVWVIQKRVEGGVSDMSDLNVLRQKLASIRARQSEAQEAAATAMAELNAMASRPLNEMSGIGGVSHVTTGEPLNVLRARVEYDQAIAQAKIARAGHLPGLSASANTDGGMGLDVTTDSLFGLGTMAEFKAIEATKEAASRRVAEAREVVARQIESQSSQLTSYERQAAEARGLTVQSKQNLELFQAQYDGGQRQVMDVVGVYETYARALETEIELKFKAARAALELARLRGALAEGARI